MNMPAVDIASTEVAGVPMDVKYQQPGPEDSDTSQDHGKWCDLCQKFIRDALSQNYGDRWIETIKQPRIRLFKHGEISDVVAWSAKGCKLCGLVLSKLNHHQPLSPPQFEIHLNYPARFHAIITCQFANSELKVAAEEFEFYQIDLKATGSISVPEHENAWRQRLASPQISPLGYVLGSLPYSDSCFGLLRAWLGHCEDNHSLCSTNRHVVLPTRVIDVWPEGGSEEPRLFVSQGMKGQYATLSHRWSRTQMMKTTMSSFQAHQLAISLHSLPATFRDAVIVTRRLGLRYLWIDSLCIIQDSPEDRRREIGRMSRIYERGCLNISALGASDSHSGLFFRRGMELAIDIPGAIAGQSHRSSTIQIRPQPSQPPTLQHYMANNELSSRGWVFQERFLAPAIVHFGRGMIFWECKSCRASETYPISSTTYDPLKNLLIEANRRPSLLVEYQAHYIAWNVVVEVFSKKKLTLASDKLPAISGLAQRFQRTFKTTFIAGLWYEDIHRGLLWSRDELHGYRKRKRIPKTPSWSWISAYHHVTYMFQLIGGRRWQNHPVQRVERASDMTVLDVKISKTNVSSPIEGVRGILELEGQVIRVTCRLPNRFSQSCGIRYLRRNRFPERSQLTCILDFDDVAEHEVFCLRVANWEHRCQTDSSLQHLAYYLILERWRRPSRYRHPSDQGEFQRIGVGADEPEKVDKFFGLATKRFIKLV